MSNAVVHFEVAGKDGPALRDYYTKLFGWKFQIWEGGPDYGLVAPGAETKAIGGGVGACPPNAKAYVTFYVQVDDVQASLDKAAKLGGRVILPPTPIPGVGTNALFTDPEGNMIGLFKPGA